MGVFLNPGWYTFKPPPGTLLLRRLQRRLKYRAVDDDILKYAKEYREATINKGLISKATKDPRKIVAGVLYAVIDVAIRDIKEELKKVEKQEADSDKAAELASQLPTQADIDKICRYESHLERQMYRAMEQLENLQRKRLGDVTPPSINLDVNVENINVSPGIKNAKRSQRIKADS